METVYVVQDFLMNVPMFPYLWAPHCIMMSLAARQVYGDNALDYAKSNPLSCFIRSLLYTYPGGILSSFLMAEPPFAFLTALPPLLTMIISWYLIFFSPKDMFAQMILKSKLTLPMSMAQDFQRLHLCLIGVTSVAVSHPKAFIYMAFIGVCKSSGFMVLKYLENAFDHGCREPFKIPNYPTKTCVWASVAFAAQASGLYDFGGNRVILAGLTLVAVNLRLFCQADPYEWVEGLTCNCFFGRHQLDLKQSHSEKASKKVRSFKFSKS